MATEEPHLSSGDTGDHEKVRRADFSWRDLSVDVHEKSGGQKVTKRILTSCTGSVKPGRLLAVMGPSGSGKTTMLNALAGRFEGGTVSGSVLVNGVPKDKSFKRVACYVPQEASLMGVLTVEETLFYAAALSGIKPEKRQAMVDEALEELGLVTARAVRVGDMFFKGISGGQKKRLSIGVELLKQPSIILLDEPTSGLDSAAAFSIISNVRELARAGRTVVATIHQPSAEVLGLFDDVLLMSRGKTVYSGPMDQIVPYFAGLGYECPQYTNPADFMLGLVNTDFEGHGNVDAMMKSFEHNIRPKQDAMQRLLDRSDPSYSTPEWHTTFKEPDIASSDFSRPQTSEYATSYMQQFLWLSARTLKNNARNPGVFYIRIVMYTILSFMIGTMFFDIDNGYNQIQDRISMFFYIAAFMVFMAVAVLPFYIQQRAVYIRERANGAYATAPYVLANFTCALPGVFALALICAVIIYFMVGMHSGADRFWIFTIDLFLALLCAESFMMVLTAFVPHYIIGIALGAGIFGMFMLCEGFFKRKDDIPGYWIWGYYIAFHTYSFRTFMYNEFHELSIANLLNPADPTRVPAHGDAVLKTFNMEEVEPWEDLLILLSYAILLQIVYYAALRIRYTPSHKIETADTPTALAAPVIAVSASNQGATASEPDTEGVHTSQPATTARSNDADSAAGVVSV